ncbi:MAG: AAA family ATPase [Nocardioides sp.]|nr:AAA family ATPase [Nocardioidaceae bacterium]MCB8958026.1 AAA family ATPase [Nocardioides sp.]
MRETSNGTTAVPDARVQRSALLARLAESTDVPLVVVSAGAGFGKTTLAAQWAAHDTRPHAVVRVGRFMDDPATLALHLVDALESVGADAGATRAVVTAAEPRFSAVVLPALSRLAASPTTPYVLVVDDIHLLADPDCHEVLHHVARGIPQGSQLAVLSREKLPESVARARVEGRLVDVGAADLAFHDAEGLRLLAALGTPLTEGEARDVVARSEGWPVGLYLMALAVGGQTSSKVPAVAPTGSDRYVLDYIRGEVLTGLPPRTREFMRRTSVVDELDVHLCDTLVQRHDSARLLADLSQRLQLVVPLDGNARHYRYHHLLSDALRVDLVEQEPWLEPELHARASSWYEATGDWDAAIRHAQSAGDLPRVSRLVWAGVPSCIASGHPDRLRAWLDGLDDRQIASDPWLTLSSAWLGLQAGDPTRMTRWLLTADDHAGAGWPLRAGSDAYSASLAAIHVLVGDRGLEGTIELCHGIQQCLPRDSGFRAAAFHNEGVALTLTRHTAQGLASLEEGERLASALGVHVIEANSLAWQGLVALMDDDWARGAPLIARAADLVRTHDLDRLATSAMCVTAMALLQAARGSKDDARVTLGTARRLTGQVRQIAPWFAVAGPLVQARVALLLGDTRLARTLFAEARGHMGPDLAGSVLEDFLTSTETLLHDVRVEGIAPDTLTPAELRVLQYLPSRLTFPEIGAHLFVSQNTIKTHALAIYRKLGTTSRNDAVDRARTLGLVESPPGA